MSFISSLKSLFSSEEKENTVRDINPNFIVRPARIKHMLQMLMESHVQISVLLDEQQNFSSRVLNVSETGITLDQLNTRAAHRKMTQGSDIQINAKHHSVPFNFSASIIGTSPDGGYLVSMPNKIYHPQKRAFFRVPLENIEKYKFTGAIQFSENIVSGYLYDISIGGVCIAVYSNTYIKKGDILTPASMTFKDGNIIHADLTVCSVKKSSQEGFTRIGCEYLDPPAAEKRNIHKIITTYERERANKQAQH